MEPSQDWKTRTTHALLWLFAGSWAFDFKAEVEGVGPGGSAAQVVFLVLSLASGTGAMVLNARELLRRPGVWLLALWWMFLLFLPLSAIAHGVPVERWARIGLPYLLTGLGLGVAQAAASRGLLPMQIVVPMLAAGCANILWRAFHGFVFKGATLESARMEVFSPAMNPLLAYLGAAFLLSRRVYGWNFLIVAVVLAGMLLTVTRALLFPMAMSMILGVLCFGLCLAWGIRRARDIIPKAGAMAAGGLGALALLLAAFAFTPTLVDRWRQRLFQWPGGGQTSADPSWLTREAEAKGMLSILEKDPVHWICGKGMGASYHWDPSYWPELWTVYPAGTDFSTEIWFNAHSLWTYTLFSSGLVGLVAHLAFFTLAAAQGLAAVRAAAGTGRPHDQVWLGFLPLFTVTCLLSESFTSNQLAERLTGVMLGLSAGISQAVLMTTRQRSAVTAPPTHSPPPPPTPGSLHPSALRHGP